jgi:hypothetical protein
MMKVLMVTFLAIMVALTVTAGPTQAQFMFTPSQDMWAAPAGTGQEGLTRLERTGIPPFNDFSGVVSSYFYAGNNNYIRGRWSGGGPGVGGDSGLSVLGQFP